MASYYDSTIPLQYFTHQLTLVAIYKVAQSATGSESFSKEHLQYLKRYGAIDLHDCKAWTENLRFEKQ